MKKLTRARRIRLAIAKTLFFAVCDGFGLNDPKMLAAIWKRIDRELKAAGLSREALDPSDE